MYQNSNTLEAARANCEIARRRLLGAPHESQRQRDAMSDLARFEAQAATLAVLERARAAGLVTQ